MRPEKNRAPLHIAMFPWLAHGHIMPFFKLSKFLAEKGHRISFISTPKNLNRISNKIPQNLSHLITLVSLPLPNVEGLPQGAESTAELPVEKVPLLKKAYDNLELGLTQFLTQSHDVSWIINDFVCHWLSRVTTPLGVNSVFFSIYSATSMLFVGSPEELLNGYRTRPEDYTVAPKWMRSPGIDNVAFKLHEIVTHWKCMDTDVSDFQRFAEVIRGCRLAIYRTCPELEPESLTELRKIYGKPVLPVGVLPPSSEEYSLELINDELRIWLDGKETNSVVYIALGTELSLSPELMHELASGVEKSGMPFVWVVNDRPLVEGSFGVDVIPPGFESRVSGRGFVCRGWVPQLGVLAHHSVGGFLTHCGWSSVIESLCFGRALILFPGGGSDLGLVARQFHGRGIGLEVPRDVDTGMFSSDSVAESIRRVMVDPEGEPLRVKARAMREVLANFESQNNYMNMVAEFLVNYTNSTGISGEI